jgi:hypothetical protein
MIVIFMSPEGAARGVRGSFWLAETEIDGAKYTARSQHGAVHALARVLVDAEVEDDEMQVFERGMLSLTYRSLHQAAKLTMEEGNRGLQYVKWKPMTFNPRSEDSRQPKE